MRGFVARHFPAGDMSIVLAGDRRITIADAAAWEGDVFNRDNALEPHAPEKGTGRGEKRGSDPDRSHHGAPQNPGMFLDASGSVSSRQADGTEAETMRSSVLPPICKEKRSIHQIVDFQISDSECSTPNTGSYVNLRTVLAQNLTFEENSKIVKLVHREGFGLLQKNNLKGRGQNPTEDGDESQMGTSPLPPSLPRCMRSRTTLILLPAPWQASESEE
jgi:hypothetical protein